MVILLLNLQNKKEISHFCTADNHKLELLPFDIPKKSWFVGIYHNLLYLNLIIQSYPNKLNSPKGCSVPNPKFQF